MQALIGVLDTNASKVSEGTIEVFLQDMFLYMRCKIVGNEINEVVVKQFKEGADVVAGHSVGSFVGHNVLSSVTKKPSLFITLCSPPVIRAIRVSFGVVGSSSGTKG